MTPQAKILIAAPLLCSTYLTILKHFNLIHTQWKWILAPIWMPAIFIGIFYVFLFVFAILTQKQQSK